MSIKIFMISLISLLSCPSFVKGQEQTAVADTLQISLLTCSPGEASYELFGHTALRVQNLKSGEDWVFNYGIFDFDTPNFALRFMLGETDYTIGASSFEHFSRSYERHGRCVVGQVLNLQPDEEARLFAALLRDWQEPDWTYRYNLLYDNCTTRAVMQIQKALNGQLVLPKWENGRRTFRDILHEFSTEVSPWNSFANDLLLGTEVDQPIDVWKQMFSPIYAESFLDAAYIADKGGTQRPVVRSKEMVTQAIADVSHPLWLTPMKAAIALLVMTLGIAVWEYKRKRLCLGVDYFWMFVQGVAGCIVGFLFFLSEHPAVDTNWLIVLLNPLPLLYLPVKVWRDRKHEKDYYYPALAIALAIFFGAALLKVQDFPTEFYVVASILLIRTINSLALAPENKK